jgi:hypothetical protein
LLSLFSKQLFAILLLLLFTFRSGFSAEAGNAPVAARQRQQGGGNGILAPNRSATKVNYQELAFAEMQEQGQRTVGDTEYASRVVLAQLDIATLNGQASDMKNEIEATKTHIINAKQLANQYEEDVFTKAQKIVDATERNQLKVILQARLATQHDDLAGLVEDLKVKQEELIKLNTRIATIRASLEINKAANGKRNRVELDQDQGSETIRRLESRLAEEVDALSPRRTLETAIDIGSSGSEGDADVDSD